MELPVDAPASSHSAPKPRRSEGEAWTIAISGIYSLVLAAGGGYVFYASVLPVSLSTGYGSLLLNYPWEVAYLLLAIVWVLGSPALLTLGLLTLHRCARLNVPSAVVWVGTVAAAMAAGVVIMRDFSLLFTSYAKDVDGTPLGPSRLAAGGPYWPALIAVGGQLAMGGVMIALATAFRRRKCPTVPHSDWRAL